MENRPKVSIILPTWKDAKYIKRSIESVLAQSFSDWELIIVDDGLFKERYQEIKEYIEKDKRIILIKNEKNLGIQKSSNICLFKSKGEYIARIDDDDEWIDKDKLKKQINFLNENPNYVLVGTGVVIVNENEKELYRYLLPENNDKIKKNILLKNCFINSSILFRKSIALDLGGYSEDDNIKHIEDYEMILRLGIKGNLYNLPIYGTKYTVRKDSITYNNKLDQFKKNLNLIKKYKKIYHNFILAFLLRFFILFGYKTFCLIPIDSFKNKLIKLYKKF